MFEPILFYPQLHMMTMHFPIALFIIGYLFDIASYVLNSDKLNEYALYNMGLGILFGIPTIISGLLSDWFVNDGAWSIGLGFISNELFLNISILNNHGIFMILCVVLFSLVFIIKIKNKKSYQSVRVTEILLLVIQSICILLLIYGAHLGSLL